MITVNELGAEECFVVIDLTTAQICGSTAYFDRDEAEAVMEKLQTRYPKANWIVVQLNFKLSSVK